MRKTYEKDKEKKYNLVKKKKLKNPQDIAFSMHKFKRLLALLKL